MPPVSLAPNSISASKPAAGRCSINTGRLNLSPSRDLSGSDFHSGTIVLFVVALFVKGFTHQLLIEAGVLLVSVKIILMSYKNIRNFEELKNDLTEIKELLKEK